MAKKNKSNAKKKNRAAKNQSADHNNGQPSNQASGQGNGQKSSQKSGQANSKKSQNKAGPKKAGQSKPRSRRDLFKYAGIGVLAIAGAVGIHQYDVRAKTLHDLSIVGEGEPVVVQVHDPSCQLCRQLKSSTQTALKSLPHIQYRIADLTTNKGREIGQQYRVGKVTLLLFDEKGDHVHTVTGVTPADQLKQTFERFL